MSDKWHTPSKSGNAMTASGYKSPSHVGRSGRFQSMNPFGALENVAGLESDGRSNSTCSPSSSGGSTSLLGHNNAGGASTANASLFKQSPMLLQHGVYGAAQEQNRRLSVATNMSSAFNSPHRSHTQSIREDSYGSPHRMTSRDRSIPRGSGETNSRLLSQRRESISSQVSQRPRGSTGPSFSFNTRAPTMLYPPYGTNSTSMAGINEALAVQELAFRQGLQDRHNSRDRIPSSPFPPQYENIWAEFYRLGKASTAAPMPPPPHLHTPSQPNYSWPVLVNPHTQSLEHPTGILDMAWTRNICEIALNCMDALIRAACSRKNDWQKLTIDVPLPCQEALLSFPDLADRYEYLKDAARQALAGGRPQGY